MKPIIIENRLKKLQEQWAELKPLVIKELEDGWSVTSAMARHGIKNHSKIYRHVVFHDAEFQQLMTKYYQFKSLQRLPPSRRRKPKTEE